MIPRNICGATMNTAKRHHERLVMLLRVVELVQPVIEVPTLRQDHTHINMRTDKITTDCMRPCEQLQQFSKASPCLSATMIRPAHYQWHTFSKAKHAAPDLTTCRRDDYIHKLTYITHGKAECKKIQEFDALCIKWCDATPQWKPDHTRYHSSNHS